MNGDGVRLLVVVETRILRRGIGSQDDPIRIVAQYWDAETGKLLAENDPVRPA